MYLNERRYLIPPEVRKSLEQQLGIDSSIIKKYREPKMLILLPGLALILVLGIILYVTGNSPEEPSDLALALWSFGFLSVFFFIPACLLLMVKVLEGPIIYRGHSGVDQGRAYADLIGWSYSEDTSAIKKNFALSRFLQSKRRPRGWNITGRLNDGTVVTMGYVMAYIDIGYLARRELCFIPYVIMDNVIDLKIEKAKIAYVHSGVANMYEKEIRNNGGVHFYDLDSELRQEKMVVYADEEKTTSIIGARLTPEIQEELALLCLDRIVEMDKGVIVAIAPNESSFIHSALKQEQTSIIGELLELLAYALRMRAIFSEREGSSSIPSNSVDDNQILELIPFSTRVR